MAPLGNMDPTPYSSDRKGRKFPQNYTPRSENVNCIDL